METLKVKEMQLAEVAQEGVTGKAHAQVGRCPREMRRSGRQSGNVPMLEVAGRNHVAEEVVVEVEVVRISRRILETVLVEELVPTRFQ